MTSQLLLLLPPSETKSDGGSRVSQQEAPARSELRSIHDEVRQSLIELSSGEADAAAKALKISAKQATTELARNAALAASPPLKPAAERYTGVLYDALDAASLNADAAGWLNSHVAIHSALYGLVGPLEPIAGYRLSFDSRLPHMPLKRRWAAAITETLAKHEGPILDLRSKGYVGLGPLPAGRGDCVWGDVVEQLPDGSFRSLNHFNKRAKGELVRLLAQRASGRILTTLEDAAELVSDRFSFVHTATDAVRIAVIPQL